MRLVQRGVLRPVLLAVLDLVERRHVAADDPLAVVVHLVELVRDYSVVSVAAVHEVDLAVAHVEAIAARPAAELVAVGIADGGHVHVGERPEHIAAVAAIGTVTAGVREDLVRSGAAALLVVALAAGHEVAAGAAVDDVVAKPAVQPLAAEPAEAE